MSYQTTVNAIRTAAEAVNTEGTFRHGRRVDASHGSIADTFPVIHLYPFQITKGIDPDFIDSNSLLMGFWKQDRPDTSVEEREAIIAEMDELASDFITQLENNKNVRLSGVLAEPQYQMFNGTVSGIALRFTFQDFTPC
jgi:hypothetical protein